MSPVECGDVEPATAGGKAFSVSRLDPDSACRCHWVPQIVGSALAWLAGIAIVVIIGHTRQRQNLTAA